MAYLDKLVKQERTGSNITGINVDTSINNTINPVNVTGNPVRATGTIPTYKIEIFDTIEKYAQEADKAKIANAKIKLSLDLEQARLDLEEKWSTVNDKFTNEDRYNEYLQAKKDLLSEQEKIISTFKYMNKEEKALALEKNNIHYRENYIETQSKKNAIHTQQQIDEIDFNIEQAITLGGKQDIHSDGKANEYLEMIMELVEHKKNLALLTDEQATAMVVGYVEKMETKRIANRLEEISISDMNYQQKLKELDKIKSYVENKEAMNYYAEKMVEKFPVENKEQAKQYFVSKITDWSSKNIKSFKAQVRENHRKEKEQAKILERLNREKEKIDMKFNPQSYSDIRTWFRKINGRELTNQDIISGAIPFDWTKAGDLADWNYAEIFDKEEMKLLKNKVNQAFQEGATLIEARNLVRKEAENLIPENTGERELKINAFIKQYVGDKRSPLPYIYGEKYPELYTVDEHIRKGEKTEMDGVIIPSANFFTAKNKKMYKEMINKISADPIKGERILKRIIIGMADNDGLEAKKITEGDTEDYVEKLNTEQGKRLIEAAIILMEKKNELESNKYKQMLINEKNIKEQNNSYNDDIGV